ncbi:MAG TPA: winged helix DNA-binding domain-containing protein [Candidatus Limnocylindrales bacterium]
MLEMTWEQACSRRLARHALIEPDESLAEVAGRVCGVHAQVMPAAEVALGVRTAGVTRKDVRAALWEDGTLVKTFGQRGTIHLYPVGELSVWMSALSAAPEPSRSLPPELRLTDQQRESVFEAIQEALTGTQLTVDELDEEIGKRAGGWATELVMPAFQGMWPRWRILTSDAARRGILRFGPSRGRNVTYTRPEDYTPTDGREALAEVVLRYLRSYGPATPQEFARWFGTTPRGATELFAELGDRLAEVSLDGTKCWLAADDTEVPEVEGGLRLLPYFDPYPVGCYPRERLFPGKAFERALSRTQAGNVPVMLIGGVVAGIWHQRLATSKVTLTVEPFVKLTAARKSELDAQADRIGEILEAKPTVTIGTVTAGKHA